MRVFMTKAVCSPHFKATKAIDHFRLFFHLFKLFASLAMASLNAGCERSNDDSSVLRLFGMFVCVCVNARGRASAKRSIS